MRALSSQTLFVGAIAAAAAALAVFFLWPDGGAQAGASKLRLQDIPFPGAAAYQDLKDLCAIGPRPSGSPGMAQQQKMLADHFKKLGGVVRLQPFRARDSRDGSLVNMNNMIVAWHPERKERILLCTHYDTRPYPDEDKRHPRGTFVGANDGTSGVAILMELGRAMPTLPTRYGVDFVFFDAEEFVFRKATWTSVGDPLFLGAQYFAQEYAGTPPPYKYKWGVLLDMVGSATLRLPEEFNSVTWSDTKPLVDDIWATAARLGVTEFISKGKRTDVQDDHLRLHDIGKIPTCDIIDFEGYRAFWHTERDTPQHCSALALAKVGWVIEEWLKQVK